MAEVIRMPRMSDTMTEGVIVAWHKNVGDKVKPGDLLAEVETDKATMELESYNEGTLLYVGVGKGKSVQVDGILAVIGKDGEDYNAILKEAEGKSAQHKTAEPEKQAIDETVKTTSDSAKVTLPDGAKEIRMPLLSDTMTEGKIVSWNKKVGDHVKSDDVLAEVETDKATMEVVGYEEGTLLYTGVEAGKAAKVNQLIAIIGKAGTDVSAYVANQQPVTSNTKQETIQPETNSDKPATSSLDERIKASPLAKKLAADKGIDLSKVKGSGDNGRITKKDIEEHTPATQQTTSAESKIAVPAFTEAGREGYTDIPLTQMRKVIARRLAESKFSAPHFYLSIEVNMDNAIQSREAMNTISPVKISFNDMIIKAAAMALRQHPAVNSSWISARAGTDGEDFIRQNHHIHIGSAVAMPEGLIVPVIKFADQKTLSQIAADAKALYGKAKDKKLQPGEFSGNTFTISNLGMMDIEEFTAIINPPDSAILAVGRIKEVVVKKESGFDTTNVMKLTLSCDHRSVDGAAGAAFLQTLKKYLENPVMMLV